MNLDNALEFVKEQFEKCEEHRSEYTYREKLSHTMRVYKWAKKLLQTERSDSDILLMAVIFHDVGYTVNSENHMLHSVKICRDYLLHKNYDGEYIEKVCEIIVNHHEKQMIHNSETSIEQILMIEADNLDETGTMSILRDALGEAQNSDVSYKKVYERILNHPLTEEKFIFCVTDTAMKIWQEKLKVFNIFIESLKNDLM